ncbi:hypothetical protein [Peribacillus frigoritolerans]|uniref:hypothetical protein n=1 Tax=Peribacillus frigoritolerans TaxID=450367 RepID=UPI0039A2EF71
MNQIEKLLWSIAIPGFGQLLNRKYVKGIVFIILEFLINFNANLNTVIIFSFQGEIAKAIEESNYHWLMFYPCLYFFAMWDAWKDAGGGKESYSFLPFVFCSYFVTIGCIYSQNVKLFGILLGPVWLPILCVIPSIIVGLSLKTFINRHYDQR